MNTTRDATDTRAGARKSGAGTQTAEDTTWGGTQESTGWLGWIAFAGIVMLMMGTFHAIQGLVALFQDSYYLVQESGLVVQVDYTAWGWIHLAVGVLVLCAGIALIAGQLWARIVAVILAFGSALVNITFLAAYPIWSLAMIALDVLIIWAVTVHGNEMKVDA
ncbi:hypothetical protein B0I08_103240 [Glaciihabitans tibetensis]|uniref:DUF7144 domain-containing protein n=1 Tax=Glaciihabitans tibetensis TaxID=1266600 RepID=A0A2T0VG51_9MICO|nr:hypothetical protein [Glaciihabitans tibetensis]PRY69034.1 hypothetical protein B0I08_103240 [Glaciihabitans tibetensis]